MPIVEATAVLKVKRANAALQATDESKAAFSKLCTRLNNPTLRAEAREDGSLVIPVRGKCGQLLSMVCRYDGQFSVAVENSGMTHMMDANLDNPLDVVQLRKVIDLILTAGPEAQLLTPGMRRID